MPKAEKTELVIEPNKGPQTAFLKSTADIAIYGGAAGSGKSFSLLLKALYGVSNKDFGAVILRKTYPEIKNEGGLWDESCKLYPLIGAEGNISALSWTWKSGASVSFAHLQHEQDKYTYQGAQIAFIAFDELTHFSSDSFWYMLSRNRSNCGIKPYVRATTNPDAGSWVRTLIDWWIDPETGYAIEARAGKKRYLVKDDSTLTWFDRKDMADDFADDHNLSVKSVAFFPAKLKDNPKGDPNYEGQLKALSKVDRERLLYGNWNIREAAGLYFNRSWCETVPAVPANVKKCRYWDLAATTATGTNDPDYTVGILVSRSDNGLYFVEDMERLRESPHRRDEIIHNTATRDGKDVIIGISQDPGQAGKSEVQYLTRMLAGFTIKSQTESGDKLTRFTPFSSQAEGGNVKILRGRWNDAFYNELESFCGDGKGHDDIADAASGAFRVLTEKKVSVIGTFGGLPRNGLPWMQ